MFAGKQSPLLVALTAILAGCATTTTQGVDVSPDVVEAEQAKQRQLAVQSLQRQQERLTDIAYPLRKAATPLCEEDVAPTLGIRFGNVYLYEEEEWQRAANAALGLSDTIQVLNVAEGSPAEEAGIQRGAKLISFNGDPVPVGAEAVEDLGEELNNTLDSGTAPETVRLTVRQDGQKETLTLSPESTCDYPAQVAQQGGLNAFADGNAVYVTSSMMRFTTDQELSVVVSHEIAHNAMSHIEKKQDNATLGAVLGALADVAVTASTGYSTGGQYAQSGAQIAGQSHSQDFEREADYVGVYILGRAGYSLDEVPEFWRHMAQANPESIGMASTHPTSAERFVRLEEAIEEVKTKQKKGEELLPEMQEGEEIGGGSR